MKIERRKEMTIELLWGEDRLFSRVEHYLIELKSQTLFSLKNSKTTTLTSFYHKMFTYDYYINF